MKHKTNPARGFTLMEVLVSVGLLGVGIFAVLGAMGAIAKGEQKRQATEYMQRLAQRRYDENLATNTNLDSPTSGDFSDWNEPKYSWSVTVDTTGNANLYVLKMTVTPTGQSQPSASVSGLVYIPATTSTTSTSTTP